MFSIRLFPMQRLLVAKRFWFAIFLVLFLFICTANTGLAQVVTSQPIQPANFGIDEASASFGLGAVDLKTLIARIVQILLGFLGMVVVLIIMYGGWIWMTSQGDPSKIDKAKRILTNAIIGLIIILSAFSIVSFIISNWNRQGGGGGNIPGIIVPTIPPWGIGGGPIESVYPEPYAKEVPINTIIAVTFKEAIDPSTICNVLPGSDCNGDPIDLGVADDSSDDNIEICMLDGASCISSTSEFSANNFVGTTVKNTSDKRTFTFTLNKYLGYVDNQERDFQVTLRSGIQNIAGSGIFDGGIVKQYIWQFQTNGELDLDPPEIVSAGVYPDPDDKADIYLLSSNPTPTSWIVGVSANLPSFTPLAGELTGNYKGSFTGAVTIEINNPTGVGDFVQVDWGSDGSIDYESVFDGSTPLDIGLPGLTFNPASPAVTNTWTINVNSGDINQKLESSYTQPIIKTGGNTQSATISGNFGGTESGLVTVNATSPTEASVVWPGIGSETVTISGNIINLGRGLGMTVSGGISSGNEWTFNVTAGQAGDELKITQGTSTLKTYIIGDNININNFSDSITLASFIKNDNASIFGDCSTASCIQTNATGITTTFYDIEFFGSTPITFTKTDGKNAGSTSDINDRKDVFRNSIFQINFNEAINPASVDNIKVRYDKAGTYTSGDATPSLTTNLTDITDFTIEVSNQYKTVELRGNIECGMSACGKAIYCWPINDVITGDSTIVNNKPTVFEVYIPTASLRDCSADPSICDSWGTCTTVIGTDERCVKTIGTEDIMLPTSSAVDGLVDMAANSFNGSFNTYIDNDSKEMGRSDDKIVSNPNYYLNFNLYSSLDPLIGSPLAVNPNNYGDNFVWRFWISDEIDLQSPLINHIEPTGNELITDRFLPIDISFDRLIRSSTLKPGYGYGTTAKDRSLRYVMLDNLTPNSYAVGYWLSQSSIDKDGDFYADYSLARINHTRFDLFVNYASLVGSGVESITQNCYLPAGGPKDSGNVSNDCNYTSPSGIETTGCVTDPGGLITLPNPASYGETLTCDAIDGASECSGGYYDCRAQYFKNGDGSTYDMGSWVISSNYPVDLGGGRTGCCFGVCEPVSNTGTCAGVGGDDCSINGETECDGNWIITSSHNNILDYDTGRTDCCFGTCIP